MRRVGALLVLLMLSISGEVSAQAQADSTPYTDKLPAVSTLVRLKPNAGASGDWMLGTLTFAAMLGQRCVVLATHLPGAPAWVVSQDDSLELAWHDGAPLRPRSRVQVDSMAENATWYAVNLTKALDGIPECMPGAR